MLLENVAYDITLDASATAVDQADLVDVLTDALLEVFLDDVANIFRRKWMKVDRVLDGDNDGLVKG
jgi:hypothetical protein